VIYARWNGELIAESDQTVIVDGNHYFPPEGVRKDLLRPSEKTTVCGWKGTAEYCDIVVDGQTNHDAAWYYSSPKEAAAEIAGRIAFWKGVEVSEDA